MKKKYISTQVSSAKSIIQQKMTLFLLYLRFLWTSSVLPLKNPVWSSPDQRARAESPEDAAWWEACEPTSAGKETSQRSGKTDRLWPLHKQQNPPGATPQTTQTGRQEKKSNTGEGKLLRSEFNSQETLDKWIQSSSLRKNTKTRLTFEKTKQKKKFGQDQWFNETKELSGRCVYCWTWTQTKGQHCLWRVEGVAVDVLPVNKSHKHSCFCFCT